MINHFTIIGAGIVGLATALKRQKNINNLFSYALIIRKK